jgi:hypothetical protein
VTEHTIDMTATDEYTRKSYNKTFRSLFVYSFAQSSSPTRIDVWCNTERINARNGQPVRWGNFGPIDGGNGRYLDPHNEPTDDETTILVNPESTIISAHGDSTGSPASGQVYDPHQADRIRHGDTLRLLFPDGSVEVRTVKMTNNGHGRVI